MAILPRPHKVRLIKAGFVIFRRKNRNTFQAPRHWRGLLWFILLIYSPLTFAEKTKQQIILDLSNKNSTIILTSSTRSPCHNINISSWPPPASVLKDCRDLRLVSNQGDRISVVLFHGGADKIEVKITERARKSRLQADISSLLDTLTVQAPPMGPPRAVFVHQQQFKRSYLHMEVRGLGAGRAQQKFTFVIGPREHWFLSVDMPISEADRLKYDQSTNSLVERDIPSSFYLGINFMPWSDVLSERYSWKRALLFKALFKVSSQPLDSAGIGIGYRLPELGLGPKTLGSTILFAAYMYDKQDVLEAGVVKAKEKYGHNWRFGISFGLDKLKHWVQ